MRFKEWWTKRKQNEEEDLTECTCRCHEWSLISEKYDGHYSCENCEEERKCSIMKEIIQKRVTENSVEYDQMYYRGAKPENFKELQKEKKEREKEEKEMKFRHEMAIIRNNEQKVKDELNKKIKSIKKQIWSKQIKREKLSSKNLDIKEVNEQIKQLSELLKQTTNEYACLNVLDHVSKYENENRDTNEIKTKKPFKLNPYKPHQTPINHKSIGDRVFWTCAICEQKFYDHVKYLNHGCHWK